MSKVFDRLSGAIAIETIQDDTLVHRMPHESEPRWQTRGRCLQLGTPYFLEIETIEDPNKREVAEEVAKAICTAICPVELQCLDSAIANNTGGVRGGTTEAERRKMVEDSNTQPRVINFDQPAHLIDLR